MNAEFYLFGKLNQNRYFQYPQDYTQFVFQSFQKNARGKTQLFIHRNGKDLVYYGYIRKIENLENQYIGFCFVLNGVLITDEKVLFQIFEDMVGNLVKNNKLVELDIQGNLVPREFTAKGLQNEFNSFRINIQLEIDKLDYDDSYLPPVNNNISSSDIQYYTEDKDNIDIRDIFSKCDNILISKNSNINTRFLLNFKQNIAIWHEREKDAIKKYNDLVNEHSQLTNKYAKLRREKKQTTFVVILVFCLFSGLFLGVSVLNEKEQLVSKKNLQIRDQENTIGEKNEKIKQKDENIASLKIKNESLRTDVEYLSSKVMQKEIMIDSLFMEIYDLKLKLADFPKSSLNYSSHSSHYSSSTNNTYLNKKDRRKYVNVYNGTILHEQPDAFSKVIKSIYANDRVYLLRDYSDNYYYVKVGNDYGYVFKGLIKGEIKSE